MEVELKKGLLDAYVLALLTRGDSYGYELMQESCKVLHISESTLYPILRRLEAQMCLSTYNREHNGRLRKYYKLTSTGFIRLEEWKVQIRELAVVMNEILNA